MADYGWGIREAGQAIASAIIQRRRDEAARARWEAEQALGRQRLAMEDARLQLAEQRARREAVRLQLEEERARREADLLEGLPRHAETLARALTSATPVYPGIPYQVPASEMGGEAREGPAFAPRFPGGARAPTIAEFYAQRPDAARAATALALGLKRPVIGPESPLGLKSPEQVEQDLQQRQREESARTKMRKAVSLMGEEDPARRAGGLALFMDALATAGKLPPESAKTTLELLSMEQGQAANDAFITATRPFWERIAAGQPLTPDDQVALVQQIYAHRQAPVANRYFGALMETMARGASPAAQAAARYAQMRAAGISPPEVLQRLLTETPPTAPLSAGVVEFLTNEKYQPTYLKEALKTYETEAAKRAAQTPEERALPEARLKAERARAEYYQRRGTTLPQGPSSQKPLTLEKAQQELARAEQALARVRRSYDIHPEDRPEEEQHWRDLVDYWRAHVDRLMGTASVAPPPAAPGGPASAAPSPPAGPPGQPTPAPAPSARRPSEKPWQELSPAEKTRRVEITIRRLIGQGRIASDHTTYEQLTREEADLLARELR
jgi:hypothetical protein